MSELALQIIRENIEKHERGEDARTLDLGNCGLTELPEEVGELIWLEELYLSKDWYHWVKKGTGDYGIRYSYSINQGENNKLKRIGDCIGKLTNLKTIVVSGAHNWDFEVYSFYSLSTCIKLKSIIARYARIENLHGLEFLQNLRTLDIGHSLVSDIQPILNNKNLQAVDLRHSNIKSIAGIENLSNLKYLNLNGNKITSLKPILPFLKKGFKIVRGRDKILEDQIKFDEFSELIEPPYSILFAGNAAILRYFEEKEKTGEVLLLEAKLILLGDGRSGKTSLANRLLGKPMPTEADRTQGRGHRHRRVRI